MRKRRKAKRAGVRLRKRRRARARRVSLRNPLVPVVRALRPGVKPSAKAYSRKVKHRRPPDRGGASAS